MTRKTLVALALALLVGTSMVPATGAAATSSAAIPDGTTLVYDGKHLHLAAGPQQAVVGESDLPSGTRLSVRIQSESGDDPFLKSTEVAVTDSGRFVATFDLSDISPETPISVHVVHEGDRLATATGVVVDCVGDCTDDEQQTMPVDDPPTATDPEEFESDELAIPQTLAGDRGSTVRVPIELGDAEQATVTIGSERVNYNIEATAGDGTGDGRVTLLFDTTNAGHPAPTLSVAESGDTVTVREGSETELSARQSALDAGEYPLELYRGSSSGPNRLVQEATLTLAENESAEDSTTHEAWPDEPQTFGFAEHITDVEQGDAVGMSVTLADEDAATVVIGDDEAGYEVVATLEDGSGDGIVDVRFDTAAAGDTGEATLTAADSADTVTVTRETTLDGNLTAGLYDTDLYRGTAMDDEADVGTVAVRDGFYLDTDTGTTDANAAGDGRDGGEGGNDRTHEPAQAGTDLDLGGLAALVVGGVLAVAGIGSLLGFVGN
ncbi:BGTF surface domain-containing protein [Haloarchaeobius sp. DFWS5]|uniref:DUF7827 domain-containing protein n=1 Tax=Haloarchaeobius sp. DFWS5 TaxID=3446114 RepID=UPI003EC072B9